MNMTDDVMQTAMTTWAARGLPARLDVVATAKLLGFAESDIQVLMAVGKLTPLGDPAPNAPKWFAAVEMIRLGADEDWLNKATKEITKYGGKSASGTRITWPRQNSYMSSVNSKGLKRKRAKTKAPSHTESQCQWSSCTVDRTARQAHRTTAAGLAHPPPRTIR